VRDHIARMISTGQFQSGAKLVQHHLARQLDVSRAVVREAIFELLGMGLVEANDNRGAVVGEFNTERLLECYELREVFEGLAARRCCERITVHQLRKLREMGDEICRLRNDGHHEQSGLLDREFHLRLTQIAGNRLLERLTSTYAVLGKAVTSPNTAGQQTLDEHQAILNDIQSGNPDAAERSAREHVRKGRDSIEQHQSDESLALQWIV